MPTIKQKKTFDKVLENGGKVGPAMLESGFSPAMAKNPKKLTSSKGWQALMDQYLPDQHLGKKHREFLDGPRIVRTFKKGDLETEVEETDPSAVKALDIAYKIKGKYPKGEGNTNNIVVVNITPQGATKYAIRTDSSPSGDSE